MIEVLLLPFKLFLDMFTDEDMSVGLFIIYTIYFCILELILAWIVSRNEKKADLSMSVNFLLLQCSEIVFVDLYYATYKYKNSIYDIFDNMSSFVWNIGIFCLFNAELTSNKLAYVKKLQEGAYNFIDRLMKFTLFLVIIRFLLSLYLYKLYQYVFVACSEYFDNIINFSTPVIFGLHFLVILLIILYKHNNRYDKYEKHYIYYSVIVFYFLAMFAMECSVLYTKKYITSDNEIDRKKQVMLFNALEDLLPFICVSLYLINQKKKTD